MKSRDLPDSYLGDTGWVRGTCKWCRGPVAPPRRTFCGDACVDEWKLRAQPNFRRQVVFARDRGICATCGCDCPAVEKELLRLLYANPSECDAALGRLGMTRRTMGPLDQRVPVHLKGRMGEPREAGTRVWDPARSLWEVDHIQAVVEGGGACGLSNLQTLCFRCHADKTAELARKRAAARASPPPPDDIFVDCGPPASIFEFDDE